MPNSSRDHFSSQSPDTYQDRRMVKRHRKPSSRSALCLLVLCGCLIMFFALVLIGCCFAINYDEDFEFNNDNNMKLEAKIQSQFNYNQYWAGVPFLVTGTLVLFSGICQRSRGLTITSVIFCIASIALTLFVLALESNNFFQWNSEERAKAYWDTKTGYSCGTDNVSKACTCSTSSSSSAVVISEYECNIVRKLSALYGAVIASAILVALFSIASITVVIKSLSWKKIPYPAHNYYNNADEFYVEGSGRRTPSFVDLPVVKRGGDHLESSNGNRLQLPYRNYPF